MEVVEADSSSIVDYPVMARYREIRRYYPDFRVEGFPEPEDM